MGESGCLLAEGSEEMEAKCIWSCEGSGGYGGLGGVPHRTMTKFH